IKTACGKPEDGLDQFARHRKLLDHLGDGHTVLEVVEHDRNRRPRALEHPGTADFSGHALHRRALGPIERGHRLPLSPAYGISNAASRHTSAAQRMRRSHPPCSHTKRRLTNGLGRRILRTISLVPYSAPPPRRPTRSADRTTPSASLDSIPDSQSVVLHAHRTQVHGRPERASLTR